MVFDLGENWMNVTSLDDGEFEQLPAGGYICIVTSVKETQTQKQRPMLVIALDIAEGDYSKCFANSKYPPRLFKVVFDAEGNISPYFKRLLEYFEQSNIQFKIKRNFEAKELLNLKIGVIFRAEEYLNNNNEIKISVRPFSTTTTATIRKGDFKVPPLKKIQLVGSAIKEKGDSSKKANVDDDDFKEVEIDDKQLPF